MPWESVENDITVGTLKQIQVAELEKLRIWSYVIYDKRQPLRPITQAFLKLLRENGRVTRSMLVKNLRGHHLGP